MDHSRINSYKACPFQYYNSYIHGIERIREDQEDDKSGREFGKCLHIALEAFYRSNGRDLLGAKRAIDEFATSSVGFTDAEKAKWVMQKYYEFYGKEEAWEILSVEERAKVNIEAGDEGHTVVLDIVAKRQTGEIYFWDHKTTQKALTPYFWQGFAIDPQITRYTEYVKQSKGQCAGAVINGISVKDVDKPALFDVGDAETLSYSINERKYSKYYKQDMVYCSGWYVEFQRQTFERTEAMINEWKKSELQWIAKMETEKAYPCNFGKLCTYCDFYDYCLSGHNKEILETMYKKKQPRKTAEAK